MNILIVIAFGFVFLKNMIVGKDRSYHSCGCIKCGLDQRVLDEEEKYYD